MAKWVPGQSGNPKGRPRRGRSVAELSRAIAQERVKFVDQCAGKDPKGEPVVEAAEYSRLERLVRVLFTMALDGDVAALRLLLEYMEGRPPAAVSAEDDGDGVAKCAEDQAARLRVEAHEDVADWKERRAAEAAQARGRLRGDKTANG